MIASLRLIFLAFFLVMAGVAPGSAQPMFSPNVEVSLVPMNQWAAPGSTAIVAAPLRDVSMNVSLGLLPAMR